MIKPISSVKFVSKEVLDGMEVFDLTITALTGVQSINGEFYIWSDEFDENMFKKIWDKMTINNNITLINVHLGWTVSSEDEGDKVRIGFVAQGMEIKV